MDEQLKEMTAPPRSEIQKAQSLVSIQRKITRQDYYKKGQYWMTLSMTIAVLFFVIFSLIGIGQTSIIETTTATSAPKLEKVYKIYNQGPEPLYDIEKWYYPEKFRVTSKRNLDFFEAISQNVAKSNELNEIQWPAAMNDYLLIYEDGTSRYLQFWSSKANNRISPFVLNPETQQVYEPSQTDIVKFVELNGSKGSNLTFLIKFVGLVILILWFIYITKQYQLIIESKQKGVVIKSFLMGIGFYVYYVIVKGISLYIFHTVHGLFVGGIMMIPFVVNSWINYKKRNMPTSLWLLPIIALIIAYLIFILKL